MLEQHALALLDRFRMRGQIGRRKHPLGGDLGDRAEPASATFSAITSKALRPSGGKPAAASLSTSLATRSGCAMAKASATVPPKPLPIRIGVAGDFEFLEAVLDRGDVGVHQRQHARLRAVEARQVEQRDAMLGGKRRQHRIEGVAVG